MHAAHTNSTSEIMASVTLLSVNDHLKVPVRTIEVVSGGTAYDVCQGFLNLYSVFQNSFLSFVAGVFGTSPV